MKHIVSTFTLIIILFVSFFLGIVRAQQPELEKSLLWEINGNGLEKSSYLYGTIHIICEADLKITPKIQKAFDESSQLVLEVDMFKPDSVPVLLEFMKSDVPLSQKLSPEEYTALDSLMQLKAGTPLQVFDNFKLSMVMSFLWLKLLPCTEPKSYEMIFTAMAKGKQLPVGALEGIKEQFDLINKVYSDEKIITEMKRFDSVRIELNEMVENYKAEDINALFSQIMVRLRDKNDIRWLLDERNNNWIIKMPEMMKQKSSFFAVGAGHLAGPTGVITLLRKQGYTVKPIMN
jgi:uncharacterized protein YbaP (TraB family)